MKKFLFIAALLAFAFRANAYHWDVNPNQYPNSMTAIAVVQIDGVEQRVNTLEVGAFCGDECRGREILTYIDYMDRYYLFLTMYGLEGDQLTFRLYDHALGQEFDGTCNNEETFATNGTLGQPASPYIFEFVSAPINFTITASASPSNGGTVSGAGIYPSGNTCILTATPATGYSFVRWTKNGSQVSTNPSYTFTVTENASYVAVFSVNSYTISVSANPSAGGTVSGGGTYNYGSSCTLTATPATGYSFVRWTKNGSQMSTNPSYTFTVTENASYVAVFSVNSYTISVSAIPSAGGTVSGGGTYNYGSTCTLTATANSGYAFVNWTENGTQVSTNANLTFDVTGNRTLVANFMEDGYIVFADTNVKALCVQNWDTNGDGELSYAEAAAVTDLGSVFQYNGDITSFDELQYFTGLSSIGNGAFMECHNLTSVIIPNSVTSIENQSFSHCLGMTSIEIPDSVTFIGGWAFDDCCSLTSIEIPNSVNTIGFGAFTSCYGLTSIVIPNSVTSIGSNAFNCGNLTSIMVDSENPVYDSRENCNAIIQTVYNSLITGCQNTIIPNSVTSIGYGAFFGCSGMTSIEIPNSVTSIGEAAFIYCIGLTSLTLLAETPPTLGNEAFNYVPTDIPFYVPCGSIEAYQNAEGWNEFTNYHGIDCPNYSISAAASPAEGGSIEGAGTYDTGTTCTLTATANEGYIFINWTENNEVVSTNATYSFTVTGDRSLVANFVESGSGCSITFNLNDSFGDGWNGNYLVVSYGDISEQLTIENGSTASYNLEIPDGSHVTLTWISGSWIGECSYTISYENGNVIYYGSNMSSNFSYGFDVDCAGMPATIFDIMATANPVNGGTVTGTGEYAIGMTCNLLASPSEGYIFLYWTENGNLVTKDSSYSFTVNSNRTLVANFISIASLNTTLSDDFNDGVINSEYWTAIGPNIYEEEGMIKIQQNVTDNYVALESLPMAVPSNNKIIIDRKFLIHDQYHNSYWGDRYFYGNVVVKINGNEDNYIGLWYYDDDYENRHGTYLRVQLNGEVTESRICDATFDTWLTERIVLDVSNETLTYYLNNTFVSTLSIPGIASQQMDYYTVRFKPDGWWTGHYHNMDYVNINVEDVFLLASLSDDFNDGVIAPELWLATGNNVYEENGLLKMDQNITDQNVSLLSVPLSVGEDNKIVVERRFKLHRGNNYYYGGFAIELNGDTEVHNFPHSGAWESTISNTQLSEHYLTFIYSYDNYWGNYGIYFEAGMGDQARGIRLCDAIFDTWLTEMTIVDLEAGTVTYYLNDDYVATVEVPELTNLSVDYYTTIFRPYGWWTGHQHYMDYINIFAPESSVNITAVAEPADGGTVTGGNTFEFGQTCTLTATPNEGYNFLYWTENGVMVSLDTTYSFTVTGDRDLVANFTEGESTCNIVFDLFDSYGDGYTGNYLVVSYGGIIEQFTVESGSFASYSREIATGSDISLSWIQGSYPQDCSFDIKFENGILIYHGSNLNASFQHELNINCAVANAPCLISAMATPEEGGSVMGAGIYEGGSTCTLTAIPNEGYRFYYWAENGDIVSTEANYSFVVSGNRELLGIFGPPLIISATANPTEGGTVSGDGEYNYNSTCTLMVTTSDGYSFMYWTENGNQVSSDSTYSFTVTSSRNLVAHFSLPLTISVAVDPTEGGTATGSGVFDYGSTCTLTAMPNPGYLFSYWTKNGNVVSYFSPYSFAVTENADYVAHFEVAPEGVCVGNPESANLYLPSYSYYKHTLSQQIYTASEIGTVGLINSVSFYNTGGTKTRNYDIYLVHTDKTTFNNNNDWIAVTETNRVFSGDVTMTNGCWNTIEFDIPFAYNGVDNLVLIVDDNSGNYTGSPHMQCRVYHTESNQAIRVYSDGTNYDPYNPSGYGGTRYSEKNQIILGFSSDASLQFNLLSQGWNWWSSYIELDNTYGLTMLESSLGQYGTFIKAQDAFVQNGSSSGWSGTLSSINNESGYKVMVTEDCTSVIAGALAVAADHPITLTPGWNWIGYPVSNTQNVTSALADFEPMQGDIIKRQDAFATYDNSVGWTPASFRMNAGECFLYHSSASSDKTLIYAQSRGEVMPVEQDNYYWQANRHAYADNLSLMATVEVEGVEQRDATLELGAFVNDECRGSAKLYHVASNDRYIAFLTVTGKDDEQIEFRLIDESKATGTSNDHIIFHSNAIMGSLDNPMPIHFGAMNGVAELQTNMSVYPNPVDRNAPFTLAIPEEETVAEVLVVNAMGEVVTKVTGNLARCTMEGLSTAGVYMVKVTCKSGNVYFSRVVVK